VAKGAAVYAAMLRVTGGAEQEVFQAPVARKLEDLRHSNVNSHSLGVAAWDADNRRVDNVIIIPKNTPLPVCKSKTLGLSYANAQSIKVKILEGEAPYAHGCVEIGTCHVAGLPAGLPKGCPVEVTFAYSEDGRIHVHAECRQANCSATAQIERLHGLGADEVTSQEEDLMTLQVI
jgi:molecular chaperone DnaK